MKHSVWHRDSPGLGRHYYLPKEVYYKYDEKDKVVQRLMEGINENLHISPSVRILTDSPYSDPERVYLEVPYEHDNNKLLTNIADIMYRSLMGYYISADPKSTHFGISNWLLEGNVNSFLQRELEKLVHQFKNREDLMGRVVREMEYEIEPAHKAEENFFFDVLNPGMDITIGYSFTVFGNKVNTSSAFIPLDCGVQAINQIYYNLDNILTQNFAVYDELNDSDYLKITNTLIFKEMVSLLQRAKKKEHTRKKILNGLSFASILTKAENQLYGKLIGDTLHDTLNHVDDPRIKESSDRSRVLFNDFMIKTAEITNNTVNIGNISLTEVPTGAKVPPPKTDSPAPPKKEPVRTASTRRGRNIKRDDLQEL